MKIKSLVFICFGVVLMTSCGESSGPSSKPKINPSNELYRQQEEHRKRLLMDEEQRRAIEEMRKKEKEKEEARRKALEPLPPVPPKKP